MPTPSNAKYNINYATGWAIVTNAFKPFDHSKEMEFASTRDGVRRVMLAAGRYGPGIRLKDQTTELEDWERRRTRKPFNRPKGVHIFRIIDSTGEYGIGHEEMTQWPAS